MRLATNMGGGWVHYGLTPTEIVAGIARAGFRCANYTFWDLDDTSPLMGDHWERQIDDFVNGCQAAGVEIIQAHSPGGNPLPRHGADYEGLVRRTIRSIECCAGMGSPHIVVHPGAYAGIAYEEFLEENKRYYQDLIPAAESTGVQILVENIGTWQDPHHVHNGTELRALVDHIGHPLVGACWDTGHGNIAGADQYASLTEIGSLLKGVHIQDNAGPFDVADAPYRQDLHTLPFLGSVNFDAVVQGLIDIGYQGHFTFEVSAPRTFDRRPFVYQGKEVQTLEWPSFALCVQMNALLYDIGKYILQQYDVFDE